MLVNYWQKRPQDGQPSLVMKSPSSQATVFAFVGTSLSLTLLAKLCHSSCVPTPAWVVDG